MHIYNDFTGYGATEMMENFLFDFNKNLFKKDVSPLKKRAYVEGLATFLKIGCPEVWMMSEDSDAFRDIVTMFGTMLLTSFDMLSEHDLLAPGSPIPNTAIISLLMLDFLYCTAGDFDVDWGCEVIRALDQAKIELKAQKELDISQDTIDKLREQYQEKEEEIEDGKNLYKVNAAIIGCTPDNDIQHDERMWARWDWKKEFAVFKTDHRGGNHYNLEKWSKGEKAEYTFSTKENDQKMRDIMGDDSD